MHATSMEGWWNHMQELHGHMTHTHTLYRYILDYNLPRTNTLHAKLLLHCLPQWIHIYHSSATYCM